MGQKKGFRHTEETKRLIAERTRLALMNPTAKNNIKIGRQLRKKKYGYINSPESRKKTGAKVKQLWMDGKVYNKNMQNLIKKGNVNIGFETRFKLGHSITEEIRTKMKEKRKLQRQPTKDTSIEQMMWNLLIQLGIEFITHFKVKGERGIYRCDIFIPSMNTIIECYGLYWHNYPIGLSRDVTKQEFLHKAGYRVIQIWENEIKLMKLNDLGKVLNI